MTFESPILNALCAGGFTWFVTALGAGCVLFMKRVNKGLLNGMLGGAAGVMIAASFWSLLAPAIEMARADGNAWIAPTTGFLLGGAFLWCMDKILPHLHLSENHVGGHAEGLPTRWRRSVLLVLAITLHNIPEGLAVGVAFGAVSAGLPEATLGGAMALTLGIGLQNFPEGLAVSAPLRREGMSRRKAFLYGQFSGFVEPVAAVLGAVAVVSMKTLLPYALSFAAGAMIYVVVEELIPSAKEDCEGSDVGTIGAMIGFAIMMVLDVALG